MKINSPFLNRVLCYVAVKTLKALFKTCRVEYHFEIPESSPYNEETQNLYIFSIWHDTLVFPLFLRPPNFIALVGPHRDGSYVTNVVKLLGFESVRGSSSKGGTQAVLQIIEKSRGKNISITPDGPRGPRRTMKTGCAFLASQTGKPVMATGFSCSKAWRIKGSWTDLVIPKPFSRVYVLGSRPIPIPEHVSREDVSRYTSEIQREMDRINEIAEAMANGAECPFPVSAPPAIKRAA